MPATPRPTLSDVERIAALSDPVLRNLQITQCYHELALVLVERAGSSANWPTFATWASRQAGQTIRKEDLSRKLQAVLGSDEKLVARLWTTQVDEPEIASERTLASRETTLRAEPSFAPLRTQSFAPLRTPSGRSLEHMTAQSNKVVQAAQELEAIALRLGQRLEAGRIVELLWKAYDPQAAFERSSAAVARGNLKVFAEIAYEFARFYAACLPDQAYDPESIASFVEALHPGDPPDGQGYLRSAFQHYYQALFEGDEKRRVELLLLANLEVGYHEQTRLQPEINEALDAPVLPPEDFARSLLKALYPQGGWLSALTWRVLRLLGRLTDFDAAAQAIVAGAQRLVQLIVTETMMTISFPGQPPIRLGEDLTARFPPVLAQLTNTDLLALFKAIDPTPDSTHGSGAEDWGVLPDRLHFIADLFRCYEVSPQLQDPPFDPEQTATIKQGRIPEGSL